MDAASFLKKYYKKPVQKGHVVLVYNGHGEVIERHKTVDLGKAYFSMSNDCFYNIYGFNFVPKGHYWELSKKAAGKL